MGHQTHGLPYIIRAATEAIDSVNQRQPNSQTSRRMPKTRTGAIVSCHIQQKDQRLSWSAEEMASGFHNDNRRTCRPRVFALFRPTDAKKQRALILQTWKLAALTYLHESPERTWLQMASRVFYTAMTVGSNFQTAAARAIRIAHVARFVCSSPPPPPTVDPFATVSLLNP